MKSSLWNLLYAAFCEYQEYNAGALIIFFIWTEKTFDKMNGLRYKVIFNCATYDQNMSTIIIIEDLNTIYFCPACTGELVPMY